MAPAMKLTALVLCVGQVSAKYFGGIGVGPFMDASDSAYCPPGTAMEQTSAFCCPTGTQQDVSQDSDVICCPSSADCTNDLVNNGIQCADPSMTLFKVNTAFLCCPAGYFPNLNRFCVNSGSPPYSSVAQSASLTPDGSTPSSVPPTGGSAVATNSAAITGSGASATPATVQTGSGTVGTATTAGGATSNGVAVGAKTSTSVSTTASHAAGASLEGGAGVMGALLAVGGMLLV